MTPRDEFFSGMRDTIPLIVGAIPFGILFGALATTAGLSVGAIMGLSLIVFAGSSQFIAATLVSQGASLIVIILTTFIVNLRHALYAASLGPFLRHLCWRWQLPLGFWLTDESYAVVIKRYQDRDRSENKHYYYLGSALLMYCNWQVCTVIGIISGHSFKGLANWGLEFAMIVTFIGIVVPLLKNFPMVLCALVAAVVATLTSDWPNQTGLIVASILAILAGAFASRFQKSTQPSDNPEIS